MSAKPGFKATPATFHPNDPQAEIRLLRAALELSEEYNEQKDKEIVLLREQLDNLKCGMRISDIPVDRDNPAKVQTHTDALAIFRTQYGKNSYYAQYGNLKTILIDGVYTIPALADKRNAFISAKIKDCKKWGNE